MLFKTERFSCVFSIFHYQANPANIYTFCCPPAKNTTQCFHCGNVISYQCVFRFTCNEWTFLPKHSGMSGYNLRFWTVKKSPHAHTLSGLWAHEVIVWITYHFAMIVFLFCLSADLEVSLTVFLRVCCGPVWPRRFWYGFTRDWVLQMACLIWKQEMFLYFGHAFNGHQSCVETICSFTVGHFGLCCSGNMESFIIIAFNVYEMNSSDVKIERLVGWGWILIEFI